MLYKRKDCLIDVAESQASLVGSHYFQLILRPAAFSPHRTNQHLRLRSMEGVRTGLPFVNPLSLAGL